MDGIEVNKYINRKCYDCCHFKTIWNYLKLPNGILNLIGCALGKEDGCKDCQEWRDNQEFIQCQLNIKRLCERKVEDCMIILLTVHERPPFGYVEQFSKTSDKSMK